MTSTPPIAPVVTQPKTRTGMKVLIGCALVLAFGLLVALGLVVAGGYWLATPGRQVPTVVAVGPRSVGQARLDNAGGDPGVRALMSSFFRAMHEASQEQEGHVLPGWLERIQAAQAGQTGQQMEMWLPSEATLSIEPHADQDGWLVAFNFKHFVRPLSLLLERVFAKDAHVRRVTQGDYQVFAFQSGTALCFADGTLLVGEPLEVLTAALERVEDFDPKASPAPAGAGLPGEWDLDGAFERAEEARALAVLLGRAGAAPSEESGEGDWEERLGAGLASARFGLDVKTGDEVRASVDFTYATPEAARAAEAAWSALLERAQERALRDELLLTATREVSGRSLRLRAGLTGIAAALPKQVRKGFGRTRRGGPTEGGE